MKISRSLKENRTPHLDFRFPPVLADTCPLKDRVPAHPFAPALAE
jgi:hypothetical protein